MRIEVDRRMLPVLVSCAVAGRFSQHFLEERKGHEAAAETVLTALIRAVERHAPAHADVPFHARRLARRDFHQSLAYRNMMALGFSPGEVDGAMKPYEIDD